MRREPPSGEFPVLRRRCPIKVVHIGYSTNHTTPPYIWLGHMQAVVVLGDSLARLSATLPSVGPVVHHFDLQRERLI